MTPDLSIIIPTLNEAAALPLLLGDLAGQQGVVMEVIVCDGGSVDDTCQIVSGVFAAQRLSGQLLTTGKGRGRQLNAGAAAASAGWLLFLHADSRLPAASQLQTALAVMHQLPVAAQGACAGRFSLRFDGPAGAAPFGLFYCEVKAALGRPGSIHGDQGLLISRSFFDRVGPFREDLPVMEDTAMAETIRAAGQWLLLPGEVITSARRFRSEGFRARQTLNALMMNCLAIGWPVFFERAPEVYRQQDQARPLRMQPFYLLLRELLSAEPWRARWAVWMATGRYVRSQAWQLGLALDCRKVYRGSARTFWRSCSWLGCFDRWFDPLTDHCLGHAVTALLVRLWFSWQMLKMKFPPRTEPDNDR